MSIKRYLVSGSLWMLIGKVVTILSMMGLYAVVARNFSPNVTGTYFLALNVVTFFSFVAQWGVGYTVVRRVSELRANGEDLFIYDFVKKSGLVFLTGCLFVAVTYFFIHRYFLGEILFSDKNAHLGFLFAVWFVLLALQFNLGEFFRAFRLINYTVIFSGIISSLLSLSFISTCIFFDIGSKSVFLILYCIVFALLANGCIGCYLFFRYLRQYDFGAHNQSKFDSRVILTQSFPYMISLIAFFVTGQSDVWLTGLYLEKSEVALYASAARIVLLINIFLVVVESVLTPLIAEMNSRGEMQQLETLLRKTATIVFLPASVIFLIFVLKGASLLSFLYGEFYHGAYHALVILAFAQMIMTVTGSCGPVLLMTGRQNIVMLISLFTAGLTVSLGIFFIPWLGKEGAAYAILISLLVQQILRVLCVRKYIGINTFIDLTLFPSLFQSFKQTKIFHPRVQGIDYACERQLYSLLNNDVPIILFMTHNRGGGVDKHIQELKSFLPECIDTIMLKPAANGSRCVVIEYNDKPILFFEYQKDIDLLSDFLSKINLVHIHIHHTKGFSTTVLEVITGLGLAWDYTLHDYFSICPQVHLIDKRGCYCQELGEEECAECLVDNPAPEKVSIQEWRQQNRYLVEQAKRCFVPSFDVRQRIQRYYPNANYITVYHEKIQKQFFEINNHKTKCKGAIDNLRIIVLGALTPMKGANLLEASAVDAKKRGLPLDYFLIGEAYRKLVPKPKSQLHVMGRYIDVDLQRLVEQSQADVVWFPACCPETYSYTLSTALMSRLPIVAPDIGAFSERLRQRPLSWIVPWNLPADDFNDFFVSLRDRLQQDKDEEFDKQFGNLLNTEALACDVHFSYESDYIQYGNFIKKSNYIPENQLYDALKYKFRPPFNPLSLVKYHFLTIIIQLRSLTLLSRIVRVVPQSFQTRLKGWLLGESKR